MSDTDNTGFFKALALANRTGTGSLMAFVVSGVIFFGLGYYYKHTQVKAKGAQIVVQSVNNDDIDKAIEKKHNDDDDLLNQSLAYIGYNTDDIQELKKGKPDRLDRLKGKFTTFIKGKTIYLPRDDCGDDYIGEDSADEANKIILDGFHRRYRRD